jgi:FKBP-type peptidyl-prolyl cis-trans isomerase SlyD
MHIAHASAVTFHYTLTDDQGHTVDSSVSLEPLAYLQGYGQIVPGLEQAMLGHQVGDRFKVVVTPEEAYGPRHPELIQDVPRAAFQGVDNIQPGMQFQGSNDHGSINVTVTKVDGETVTVDGNHPLAGQVLNFDIEVVTVRESTPDERRDGRI